MVINELLKVYRGLSWICYKYELKVKVIYSVLNIN